jgi:hypothetical protein
LLRVRWRIRQGHDGGTTRSPIVCRCSEQGVLWWTRRLLLQRTHPWPHRDGAGAGIGGGPRRGAPAVVAAVVTGDIVLAFPLALALTLAFVAIVREGEGPPNDTMVPTVVSAEAVATTEGTLHLRARSRRLRMR